MAVIINISITPEHIEKLNSMVKDQYRKRSELIRKWINGNYEEVSNRESDT
jgi:metal-responsive CopG/Arc/MetJ family transcriptional regulator